MKYYFVISKKKNLCYKNGLVQQFDQRIIEGMYTSKLLSFDNLDEATIEKDMLSKKDSSMYIKILNVNLVWEDC